MRKLFYPESLAVFGVSEGPRNLAKNIIINCRDFGYHGDIFPVGKASGRVLGQKIITRPEALPEGIDLAVILVPARFVAEVMETCGKKGIRRAVISTGGFSEFETENNQAEKDLLETARKYRIRFVGPNCIGAICSNSGLCTPFNPMQPKSFKKGRISLIVQSGGVTNQCAYHFSEEHLGFSKIISAGNKLDLSEIDFIEFLMGDEDTDQIHLYLESIEDGRELIRLARQSKKPIVIYKSNVSLAAAQVAKSHTAALSNNDLVVGGALRQAGIVRARDIHDMTVAAKALTLPPLKGDRLAVISMSGGFSVILGNACEEYGFSCPELPRPFMDQVESYRRGGVIRMSNPMDFGDIHNLEAISRTIEDCLAMSDIDGLIVSFMYSPEMKRIMNHSMKDRTYIMDFMRGLTEKYGKPAGLSFFAEKKYIDEFKQEEAFPVFNDAVESVRAFSILREYWRGRTADKKQDHE